MANRKPLSMVKLFCSFRSTDKFVDSVDRIEYSKWYRYWNLNVNNKAKHMPKNAQANAMCALSGCCCRGYGVKMNAATGSLSVSTFNIFKPSVYLSSVRMFMFVWCAWYWCDWFHNPLHVRLVGWTTGRYVFLWLERFCSHWMTSKVALFQAHFEYWVYKIEKKNETVKDRGTHRVTERKRKQKRQFTWIAICKLDQFERQKKCSFGLKAWKKSIPDRWIAH